ncbi:universal stress protein [Halobium palmae]|uniref:Universal stress protein n=1 Tax=Halobium palmae TaxID=1776492 RepID=A0ABD5S420_9EURY
MGSTDPTNVLVPLDGSECSRRALEFAVALADRFDADLHVVHFSDHQTDATDTIIDRAHETVEAAGLEDDPELIESTSGIRNANHVGAAILELVEDRGYDHVVMGHHGEGTVGRAILGSAAETMLRSEAVAVTVVPTVERAANDGET